MSKKKLLTISVVTIAAAGISAAAGVFGVQSVMALTSNNPQNTLIQNLATKFNVSTSEVQAVFDQTRTDQENARLDNAVSEGVITEEQKTLIINKRNEIDTKLTEINNKQLTASERQSQINQLRTEIETWANSNKIPIYLVGFGPMGMEGGKGDKSMMRGGF